MQKYKYKKLKVLFFDWCSVLSLDEIVSNPELMRALERVERLLIKAST